MNRSYWIEGVGETSPALVKSMTTEAMFRARQVCVEEKFMMSSRLLEANIPRPSCILRKSAKEAARISVDAETVGKEPGEFPAEPLRVARCQSHHQRWSEGHYSALSRMLKHINSVAAEGPILVYGTPDAASLASTKLTALNRKVSLVTRPVSSQGKSSLSANSTLFASALRRSLVKPYAAVLLIGYDEGESEIASLVDVGIATDLWHVGTDGVLRYRRIAEVSLEEKALPIISVVTVSFNQAVYLEDCIRSVLDQGYPKLDFIIVDGGSTDGSREIIERYREYFSKVLIEKDEGQSDALNKGFAFAKGDVMNWLCSDDMLQPGALMQIGRTFAAYKCDLIIGSCEQVGTQIDRYVHDCSLPLGKTINLDPIDLLMFTRSWLNGNYFFQPEVFFSREAWLRAGGYIKKHLYYLMDYDLWLRMALAGATARVVAAPIGISRMHDMQKTKDDCAWGHQLCMLMDEYNEMFGALQDAEIADRLG